MTAARTGKVDAVKVLIAHGADVNFKESRRGQTALMWAAADGNTAVVEELVERGADMKARTKGGFTPLLFAVREGRSDTVRALLKAGANVNEPWQAGRVGCGRHQPHGFGGRQRPLRARGHDAGRGRRSECRGPGLDRLASDYLGAQTRPWRQRPRSGGLRKSVQSRPGEKLVAKGANVNARMTKQGNVGRTSLNMIGATPFLMAARTADAPLMRLLAELGADPLLPNADNTTPLLAAAGVGTYSAGEDPGTETEVLEAVKVALELGGDVNAVDNNGETVIHAAAYKQVPSVAQFLIDKGAKIEIWNQKNKTGWTPLRIADGVMFGGATIRNSPEVAVILRQVMSAAGVSTVVEPDIVRAGHPVK